MGCALSKHSDPTRDEETIKELPKEEAQLLPPPSPGAKRWQPNRSESFESKRLQSTIMTGLMCDQPPEAKFLNITNLMATVFDTPVSSVNVFGRSECFMKAAHGGYSGVFPRDLTVCDSLLTPNPPQVLVVEDTLQDARYSKNSFVVGEPNVRFYAGAPLVGSDGYTYGSLCVIDFKPRSFPAGLYNTLANFAELAVREMERNKSIQLRKTMLDSATKVLREPEAFRQPVAFIEIDRDNWTVLYVNDAWANVMNRPVDQCVGSSIWEMLTAAKGCSMSATELQAAIREGRKFELEVANAPANSRSSPDTILRNSMDSIVSSSNGEARMTRQTSLVSAFAAQAMEQELLMTVHPADVDALEQGTAVGVPSYIRLSNESDTSTTSSTATNRAIHSTGSFWFAVLKTPDNTLQKAVEDYASNTNDGSLQTYMKQHQPLTDYSLQPPTSLQDVKLGPLVGSGAYAKVYRGKWRNRLVAVKIIDAPSGDEDALQQLVEGAITKDLNHPNIVKTIDYSITDIPEGFEKSMSTEKSVDANGDVYVWPGEKAMLAAASKFERNVWIIEEFCNTGSLLDAIERGWFRTERVYDAPPHFDFIVRTAVEIASALKYLHDRGIVHGDLSGNNVLLVSNSKDARGFNAKISDFGLARTLHGDAGVHHTETIGTVSHMPPELLSEGIQSPAGDIYSFGVILNELYCGVRAWMGFLPAQVMLGSMQGRKLDFPEDTPVKYKELADKCMAFRRLDRPSADIVLRELNNLMVNNE